MPEFLVHFEINLPVGLSEHSRERIYREEAEAARPFLENGTFARVWREPGQRHHWAIWDAPDADYVHRAYETFPMFKLNYGRATVYPLAVNPNDPGYPAQDRPDLKMTWASLSAYYDSQPGTVPAPGSPQAARHETKTVMLTPTVSIHMHDGVFPREIHFMCDDVKVAELGPDENLHGEPKAPRYVDILAEWDGAPVAWRKWKARILQDNRVLHPDYATALSSERVSF